jgi:hypothetical protein
MSAPRRRSALVLAGLAVLLVLPAAALAAPTGGGASAGAASAGPGSLFNRPGNLLITDQFNNRVVEVNPLTQAVVWSFGSGNGSLCNPGPHAVIGPNDAERIGGGYTLIAGTGIPAGVPGTKACVDNRVIVVDRAGTIVWQYGKAGKTGSGPDLLNTPVFAVQLPDHHILITDQGNNRIIEVNLRKQIVWSYGPTSGPGALNSPNSAERLANGDTLIADEGNNRVIEVNASGGIVWQYYGNLSGTAFASRLPNGDTLIADSGNNRVLEVSPAGKVVWQYYTNRSAGSNAQPNPTGAVRIAGGYTLIADQFNDRVLVVDDRTGVVTYQYGQTDTPGNGYDQLYGPYSADAIGDYLGLTPPPATFR